MANLVAITLNRYVKIVHTASYPRLYSKQTIRLSILLTWTLTFGSPLPTFFGYWGTIGPKRTDASTCTIVPDAAGRSPTTLLWILGNCAPITIMLWCYGHIRVHVHRSRTFVRKFSNGPDAQPMIAQATPRPSIDHLDRMTCLIVGGYLFAFEPILILGWFDTDDTPIPPSIHLLTATMAWSTSWMNLLIYVTTNRDYREAYRNLFWPRRTLSSKTQSLSYVTGNTPPPPPPPLPPKPTNLFNQIRPRSAQASAQAKSWMTRMVIGLSVLGVAISTKAPACTEQWETHHVIPACVQTAQWLHIQTNGSICARSQQCLETTTMVSPDAKSCIPTRSCTKRKTLNVDSLQCQTNENATFVDRLRIPPLRSTLCSVGALTLRKCPDYVERFEDVPIAIVDGQAYPLDVLRISQYADTSNFSSYTCKGSCDHKCEGTECHGDTIFCAHFTCAKRTNNIRDRNSCECTFNSSSLSRTIPTDHGNVVPSCWGYLDPTRQNTSVIHAQLSALQLVY
jgi:hypothetical protein